MGPKLFSFNNQMASASSKSPINFAVAYTVQMELFAQVSNAFTHKVTAGAKKEAIYTKKNERSFNDCSKVVRFCNFGKLLRFG